MYLYITHPKVEILSLFILIHFFFSNRSGDPFLYALDSTFRTYTFRSFGNKGITFYTVQNISIIITDFLQLLLFRESLWVLTLER